MHEHEAIKLFEELHAIERGHFSFASGMHSNTYVDKTRITPHTEVTSRLCLALADWFANDEIEVVIGPALGAVVLAHTCAYHLSKNNERDVLALFAEKELLRVAEPIQSIVHYASTGKFIIKRGYAELITGKRVLAIEDVLTTGGSAKKVVKVVRALGGTIIGVGALWNRGNVKREELDVPKLFSIINVFLPACDPKDCAQCAAGIPIDQHIGYG